VILLDTSALLAALDSSQRQHAQAVAALRAARGPLLSSPFVLDELDSLLATRVGLSPIDLERSDSSAASAFQTPRISLYSGR
jgi:predicted nucleic acid-binding protein